jgi:hypothetical protein
LSGTVEHRFGHNRPRRVARANDQYVEYFRLDVFNHGYLLRLPAAVLLR